LRAELERVLDDRLGAFQPMVNIDGPLIAQAVDIPAIAVPHGAASDRSQQQENGCHAADATGKMKPALEQRRRSARVKKSGGEFGRFQLNRQAKF
jgi:hypothetical protein